jgi:hypothetical protein
VVEFALVAPLAIVVALAVAQFALFLYERNVVMGSLSEGARVAAASGRTIADGERATGRLLREALGGRIATRVLVRGVVESGLVRLRADATLPSFVPGVPGLEVHMTAVMHKEEDLGARDGSLVAPTGGEAVTSSGGDAVASSGGDAVASTGGDAVASTGGDAVASTGGDAVASTGGDAVTSTGRGAVGG